MAKDYKNTIKEKKEEAQRIMTEEQSKKCNVCIHTASVACAAAGVVPIPVADAIPMSAAQILMIVELGKIFNRKITDSAAKGMIGAAASTFVGRTIIKFVPFVGWAVSATIAAGVTEAIGWTIAVDFAKGTIQETDDVVENTNNYLNAELVELENIIKNLPDRAEPFLKGEKCKKENTDEYYALRKDFEKVLDNLEESDPLRKTYDNLCNL